MRLIFFGAMTLLISLCGCTSHPLGDRFQQFNNVTQPIENQQNMDAEDYRIFQNDLEELFTEYFSKEELQTLNSMSNDSNLIILRRNLVSDYNNDNKEKYNNAVKQYLGDALYSKITSENLSMHYSDILKEYQQKMIQKDLERREKDSNRTLTTYE